MDKKFLILLLLLTGACRNTFEYHPEHEEPQMIMNAQLKAGEKNHIVKLAVSTMTKITDVKGPVKVLCYVNGVQVAQAEEIAASAIEFVSKDVPIRTFSFKADFNPGDEVTVTADAIGYSVSASAVVPAPAKIIKTESSVIEPDYKNYSYTRLRLPSVIEDLQEGEDFYMLEIFADDYIELYSGGVRRDSVNHRGIYKIQTGDDYVLKDNQVVQGPVDDILGSESADWYFCVFRDGTFDGKQTPISPIISYPGKVKEKGLKEKGIDSIYVKTYVKLSLSHINSEEYYYVKALRRADGGGNGFSFTMEYVDIPENIKGGTGFFSISNPDTLSLRIRNYGKSLIN